MIPLFVRTMEKLKVGTVIEVEVEKLIYGGAGLARYEGQVVFIDYAAPGDKLEVEIIQAKKNFLRGKILKILNASVDRVTPPCPVFGTCGGCQWQHINYSKQIEAKQNILSETVKRFFPHETIQLDPFLESPDQYHYRNRIQVRAVAGRVGFYGKGSHDLVEMDHCPIAEPSVNKELSELIKTNPQEGKYRIQVGLNGVAAKSDLQEGEEPLGFAQVNTKQNVKLQKKIIEQYAKYSGSAVIDLYGGYGNLSLPLAEAYPQIQIESVEWNRQAVAEGVTLARQKNAKEIKFICGDVAAYLQRVKLPQDAFVILDPPRDGCSPQVMQELAWNRPRVLVYVSCDPMTWGRDGQIFIKEAQQKGGHYRIATIHGLDMFPHTDHIEVFSVFERMD